MPYDTDAFDEMAGERRHEPVRQAIKEIETKVFYRLRRDALYDGETYTRDEFESIVEEEYVTDNAPDPEKVATHATRNAITQLEVREQMRIGGEVFGAVQRTLRESPELAYSEDELYEEALEEFDDAGEITGQDDSDIINIQQGAFDSEFRSALKQLEILGRVAVRYDDAEKPVYRWAHNQ